MTKETQLRLVICCSDEDMRRRLRQRLQDHPELQIVGEAENVNDALELCELTQPDLVLASGLDEMEARRDLLAALHQHSPGAHLILLGAVGDELPETGGNPIRVTHLPAHSLEGDLAGAILKETIIHPHHHASGASPTASQLEQLEAEIQEAVLEPLRLGEIFSRYLPGLFPGCQVQVRIFPDLDVFAHPSPPQQPAPEFAWRWLSKAREVGIFPAGAERPWGKEPRSRTDLLLAPIPAERGGEPSGGIALACPQRERDLQSLLAPVEALRTALAAPLSKMQDMVRWLAQQRTIKELEVAARIQAGILPDKPPSLPGWDLAAVLESAHETSGDFFDFIPLERGKWGIVIADVTDKGLGAALFMALCSTLIRTYSVRFPSMPAVAMDSVNKRIFSDTRGSLFVTAFYGILEPETGRLRYVNAGHNPPFLVSAKKGKPVDRLQTTGMALGISEEAHWQQRIVKLLPGDTLVLYTDGVTEATNQAGDFFGDQRLLEVIRTHNGQTTQGIQKAILKEVRQFNGGQTEQDDIALVIVQMKGR